MAVESTTEAEVPLPERKSALCSTSGTGIHLEQAIDTLRAAGLNISEELLTHLSPLGWEHIVLTGEYRWTSDSARRPGQRRDR
ncbi:MAG: Tn3 family transposase [Chloroflexi bacterium]|nr:Tn3 family transposase [Chloroflexota bacterium]